MKIPKKKELLRLQAKYRTDKKIGQALGGVPAHLVAYWRKKKKIPDCDLPKYSQKQIKTLWETYGSDKPAAAQLGITPAAFYKWRQKYGIKERPKQLKLSHLQLHLFPESQLTPAPPGSTLVEKLLARKLERRGILSGERYELEPDLIVLSSDWEKVLESASALNLKRVKRPDRVWAKLPDGLVCSNGTPTLLREAKEFLNKNHIKNVISAQEGESLQLLWEKAVIPPLGLAFGTDILTAGSGFYACWGQKLESPALVQLLETGKIWLEVPQSVSVVLKGELSPAIFASDIYSFLRQQIEAGLLENKIIELSGPALLRLSLPQRLALALMLSQSPVRGVLFPADEVVRKHYLAKTKKSVPLTASDQKAVYAEQLEFDLSLLEPQVCLWPLAQRTNSVRLQKKRPLSKIILGAGLHGRLEELEIAAKILAKRKVHPEVQFLVVPSSRAVLLSALKKGYIRSLLESGAILCNPGLENWPGIFSSSGALLSTCHLNSNNSEIFQSRELYFASPATAAASALKGEIADPRDYL
jgi:3-isopropylmalate/(R)-2-methylmalate dehydratase large subunit